MISGVRIKLLGAELMVKLKQVDLPGVDFEQAGRMAHAAAQAGGHHRGRCWRVAPAGRAVRLLRVRPAVRLPVERRKDTRREIAFPILPESRRVRLNAAAFDFNVAPDSLRLCFGLPVAIRRILSTTSASPLHKSFITLQYNPPLDNKPTNHLIREKTNT